MKITNCPACGATLDGEKCSYCGWVFNDQEINNTEQKMVEAEEKTESFVEDMIADKVDFLNPEGQLKLGFAYLNGVGVQKSAEKAAEMFLKSALGGNAEGLFQYAESLNNGRGIKQDKRAAILYYMQAASMGHIGARIRLNEFSDSTLRAVTDDREMKQTMSLGGFEQLVSKIRQFCVEFTCCMGNIPASQGSGCVFADGKFIITNAHVVLNLHDKEKKLYDNIFVNFDGKYDDERYAVEVVAVEPSEDIALCIFKNDMPQHLTCKCPILAEGYDYCVGKEVFTIGNGLGRGLGLSKGVISRDLEKKAYGYSEVVRTDMSINPGNSGGALFDMDGNIIGMMTFVAKQGNDDLAYGMSYAITSNTIVKFLRKIVS